MTAGAISAPLGDLDLTITARAWAWMIAPALLGQVAAWLFVIVGSRDLPTNTIAGLLFLQPVLAIVFGFLLLHERLTRLQLLGAAVVVDAVWTTNRHSARQRRGLRPGVRSVWAGKQRPDRCPCD